MSIRETLNQRKGLGVALAAGLIIVAAAVKIWASHDSVPAPLTRAFYSDDDGKTYFADDVNRICPFDHDGKPADRANVFQCPGGQPFVLYLERYSASAKSKLDALSNNASDPTAASAIAELRNSSIEIKRPGDKTWVSPNSAAGNDIAVPKCPGGGIPHGVYP
jgi:hypothetical protein